MREAAEELRVSARTVERLVADEALPAIRFSPRCTRIARADLVAYIAAHRSEGAA